MFWTNKLPFVWLKREDLWILKELEEKFAVTHAIPTWGSVQMYHINETKMQLASWSQSSESEFDSLSQIPYQETSVVFCTDQLLYENKMVDTEIMLSI